MYPILERSDDSADAAVLDSRLHGIDVAAAVFGTTFPIHVGRPVSDEHRFPLWTFRRDYRTHYPTARANCHGPKAFCMDIGDTRL